MKLFTVEEANALLPELRRMLGAIDRQRGRLQQLSDHARAAQERSTEGGGTRFGTAYAAALTGFLEAVQEVFDQGIEIKDFDRGLCDFPHLRDGKVVFLCWQRGEVRVEWWHEIEAGFAGRQPL
jgi:hypothetical protein